MILEYLKKLEEELETEKRNLENSLKQTRESLGLFSEIMEYQVREILDRREHALH
jgi:hypothetical protein